MSNDIEVGVEVAAWTYNECDGCGCTYPVTRTSVKTIVESDLMCVSCWSKHISEVNSDETKELTEQLAIAKVEIAEYREILSKLSALIKPISSSASEYIDSTLAKHEELK